MTKKNYRYILTLAGFLLYVFSLCLPALRMKIWEKADTVYGIVCLILGPLAALNSIPALILCLLSNVFMLVSFVMALVSTKTKVMAVEMLVISGVILLAPLQPMWFGLDPATKFLIGYFVWLASFVVIAIGLTYPKPSKVSHEITGE